MDIYPSLLEKTAVSLSQRLQTLSPFFDHFQIDITDGIFVPTKTVQIEKIVQVVKNKTFEFHLMVKNWKKELAKLEKLDWDINRVLVHASVFGSSFQPQTSKFSLGLVLNPEDSVTDNLSAIMRFPTVQLMTVHPGKQGSPFVPEVLGKIEQLRENGYTGEIVLDGAMNDKTLAMVLRQKYLPDAICPGSYFKEDVKNRLQALEDLIHG